MYPRTFTAALAALALAPSIAAANPKPLPFSYTYETLGEGELELETYADMTPVRSPNPGGGARTVVQPLERFQTEFETGLTDRLELGLYVTFQPTPPEFGSQTPLFAGGNGVKQRLRYRLTEPGALPIDIAVYGEVAELHNEIELEGKIILQRRFGPVRAIVNLWGEREFYYNGQREWVLNPTAGLTAQVTPTFHVGIESWMRKEYLDDKSALSPNAQLPFNLNAQFFLGPAVLLNLGKLWWNTGVYGRLNDTSRAMQVGDVYGHVWVRTTIGLAL
jgi:hypothetical protein